MGNNKITEEIELQAHNDSVTQNIEKKSKE